MLTFADYTILFKEKPKINKNKITLFNWVSDVKYGRSYSLYVKCKCLCTGHGRTDTNPGMGGSILSKTVKEKTECHHERLRTKQNTELQLLMVTS